MDWLTGGASRGHRTLWSQRVRTRWFVYHRAIQTVGGILGLFGAFVGMVHARSVDKAHFSQSHHQNQHGFEVANPVPKENRVKSLGKGSLQEVKV